MSADDLPDLTVRPLAAEEWDGWYRRLEVAFGGAEEPAEERELWQALTEVDRSFVICEDGLPVGGGGSFGFRMAVPGGAVVPCAGVTMVGVLPTHRRRGGLTVLMRRLLADVRGRGEALAVLTASEAGIYGRFGFGRGTWRLAVTAACREVALDADGAGVRLRLADPLESLPACEELYAGLVPLRPGMLERRPGWEQLPRLQAAGREGWSPLQCVLAEEPGTGRLLGYARYAVKGGWAEDGRPVGRARVRDVEAVAPRVYARLWRYLLELDLVESVYAGDRPVDDPLLHLVSDVRRLDARVSDALYVRPVEVGAALELRGYAAPVDVVLEVADAFCPWNAGRWRLRCAGPGGAATCRRTEDAAGLALDVRDLGAVFLGGTTLAALAAAGRVVELRAGELAPASRAFASDVAPWLPHGF
ncbi:GNAT family N-acetyltransferase [Kitasatospora sp. NPDC059571]|uniref:GNAT family N-acetyltransferase n=1 Tax=Kitasatospora sp. NPDC059571 TaxID=3346871 RepID=UPI0036A54616